MLFHAATLYNTGIGTNLIKEVIHLGKKQYTPEEQVARWEATRAVENLVGKRMFYGIYRWSEKCWEDLWCRKAPEPTLGFNNGYYKGYEAIGAYFKACQELAELKTRVVKEANPEELAGKSLEELYGVGSLDVWNMTTPIVEVADDLKTAKGLWYYLRGNTDYTAAGITTYHQWGWMGVDFVNEDGEWKIWHMVCAEDLNFLAGTSWTEPRVVKPVDPKYAEIGTFKLPEPNVPMTVFEYWHDRRKQVDFPGVPKNYATFAETFSYGI